MSGSSHLLPLSGWGGAWHLLAHPRPGLHTANKVSESPSALKVDRELFHAENAEALLPFLQLYSGAFIPLISQALFSHLQIAQAGK